MDYETARMWAGLVGLLIFVGIFLAVLLWVFLRPDAKRHFNRIAEIPLREDD